MATYVTPVELQAALDALEGRLGTLIRQLQGALGGRQTVTGFVSSAGAVGLGTGFTAARLAAGDYRLTFDPAFRGIVSVVAMPGQGAGSLVLFKQHSAEGATQSTFRLASVTPAGVLADSDFWFVAAG